MLRLLTVRCVLAGAMVLGGIAAARAQGELRFGANAAPVDLSPSVLTPEERRLIAVLPEVRVAIPDPPTPPYERFGADGVVSGIHADFLLPLSRTFGIKVRPVLLPSWSAVLAAARAREVDLVLTIGVTTERLQYLEYPLGVSPVPGALFGRSNAPPVDLDRASFALEREFLVNEFVGRQYPRAQVLTVETTGDALRAVAEGRADCYLGNLLEAREWLAEQPVAGVVYRYVMGEDGGLKHMYVSPGARSFLGLELDPRLSVLANLAPYMREDHRQDSLAQEAASAVSGERYKSTGQFQLPGQAPRWLHSEAVRPHDDRGREVWTGYVVDVSSERELQERLAGKARSRKLLLAAASHELRAPTHNLSLALGVAADLPAVAQCDPLRLRQVLVNLLSNACKYTHRGSVRLVVKRATDAEFDSAPDSASDSAPEAVLDAADGHGPVSGSTGLGLVVCDDDPVSRLLASQVLRLRGYEVIEADGGEATLAACERPGVGALLTAWTCPAWAAANW